MPGGGGGFVDVKITISGTSKMCRTTPPTGTVGGLTEFDQIVQISWKKGLVPFGIEPNSQNNSELPEIVILMSSKPPPLAYEGGKKGLIS